LYTCGDSGITLGMQDMDLFCRAPSAEAFERFAKLVTSILDVPEVAFTSSEQNYSLVYQGKSDSLIKGPIALKLVDFTSVPVLLFQKTDIGSLHFSLKTNEQTSVILKNLVNTLVRELELEAKNLALEDETLSRFKNIFDQAPFSIQICTRDGRTLLTNPAWKKIFNLSDEFIQNFIMKEYNVLTDPLLEASGLLPLIKRGFAGEIVELPEMFYDPTQMGIESKGCWLKAQVFPLRNSLGDFREVVIIHNNVTEITETNRQNELLLKTQERTLRDQRILSKVTSILISTLDYDKIIHEVAEACIEEFCDGFILDLIDGSSIQRLVNRHRDPQTEFLLSEVRRLYPPDSNSPQPSSRVIRSREPEFLPDVGTEEIAAHCKNEEHAELIRRIGINSHIAVPLMIRGKLLGALNFLNTTSRPHFDDDDFYTSLELSRRAAIAIENSKLFRDAQKAIQLRDDFISIASHELKTPITSMKLQMQMATQIIGRDDSGPVDPVYIKNLTEISNRQLEKITRLVEDMLDISRISTGKLAMNFSRKNLAEILEEVLQRFSDQLRAEKITFSSTIEPDVFTYCDSFRIEQVITNLISNAIRYGKKQPIEFTMKRVGDFAEIKVKDYGIGVNKSNHERIFERFERAVSYNEMSGLGIGLYITKEIVEEHQGKISVESELGKGATFKVVLPCL
jgi:signal transduction histidine kinase/PAS domain-containing protein